MKKIFTNFFENSEAKKRSFLIGIAAILLIVISYLGIRLLTNQKFQAIDFSRLTEQEAVLWSESKKMDKKNLKISYEFSETIPKGILISQNPKEGEDISKELLLVYSKGFDPKMKFELPKINEKTTKADLEKWFKDKHFDDVRYEYILDEQIEKDLVIKMNVSGMVSRDTAIIVTLSAGDDIESVEITTPDFSTFSKDNILAWANNNGINIHFQNINDENVSIGKVLSQSVAKGTMIKPGSTIVVEVSAGNAIVVADFYGKPQSSVQEWASKNNISVSFDKVYSETISEGLVIATSPKASASISAGEKLYVSISAGKDPKKKTVKVDGSYLGKTEDEFKKYIDSLGLSVSKNSVTYYSTTIPNGSIYAYDDGEFTPNSVISYSLSKGPYIYDANRFEGKHRSEVESYVTGINNLNGHLSLSLNEVYDSRPNATVFGCSKSQNGKTVNVQCSVSIGSKPVQYPLPNYVGNQNPCGTNNSCYVADGHIRISIRYQESTSPAGQVLSQSVAAGRVDHNTEVVLVVASEIRKQYIADIETLDALSGSNFDETVSNLQYSLSGFENVRYQRSSSNSYTKGRVISVSVGGNTNYEPGNYPINTAIVITISDGMEN